MFHFMSNQPLHCIRLCLQIVVVVTSSSRSNTFSAPHQFNIIAHFNFTPLRWCTCSCLFNLWWITGFAYDLLRQHLNSIPNCCCSLLFTQSYYSLQFLTISSCVYLELRVLLVHAISFSSPIRSSSSFNFESMGFLWKRFNWDLLIRLD